MCSEVNKGKTTMEEGCILFKRMKLRGLLNYLRVRRGENGFLQRNKDFLTSMMSATRQGWWLKAMLMKKEMTKMRYFLQL